MRYNLIFIILVLSIPTLIFFWRDILKSIYILFAYPKSWVGIRLDYRVVKVTEGKYKIWSRSAKEFMGENDLSFVSYIEAKERRDSTTKLVKQFIWGEIEIGYMVFHSNLKKRVRKLIFNV